MPKWKGKTRGGVFGYKFFIYSIKFFGIKFGYLFLYLVSFYFFLFSPNSFISQYLYFNRILKYNIFYSIIAIYKNLYIFGQILIDKMVILAGFKNKFNFIFEGENYLQEMIRLNKGGLLISAHLGNWEVAGSLLNRLNTKVNIIMYDDEYEKIKTLFENVFKNKNFNVISIKDDFSHVYSINQAINNKELLCIHADRFIDGSRTINQVFLGREAKFPCGPFQIALKYQIPVSFVFAMKETSNMYHFYASKLYLIDDIKTKIDRTNKLSFLINEYIKTLEYFIIKYPLQWFNFYDFWELK